MVFFFEIPSLVKNVNTLRRLCRRRLFNDHNGRYSLLSSRKRPFPLVPGILSKSGTLFVLRFLFAVAIWRGECFTKWLSLSSSTGWSPDRREKVRDNYLEVFQQGLELFHCVKVATAHAIIEKPSKKLIKTRSFRGVNTVTDWEQQNNRLFMGDIHCHLVTSME